MAFVPVPGSFYYLVAAHSGKVLEVAGAAKTDGALLQQADPLPYFDSFHQQFQFAPNGDRIWVLYARHSMKVFDVQGGSKDDGANIHQWGWHGVDHERLHAIDAGDGTFFLQFLHSGKVCDVFGESKAAGARLVQHSNHGTGKNLHQRFRPVLAEEGFAPAVLPGFTNPSQMVRDATLGIAGLIPEAGGAIKAAVAFLWPDAGPSMIWNQVMRYIEAYVESKLEQARITSLRETIGGAQINLEELVDLNAGTEKATKLIASITALNQVDRPFLRAKSPEQTVSYLVTIGTIKLTLLQELARNYAALAKTATDDNQAVHLRSLRKGIVEYTRAARYFRAEALDARVARIGNDIKMINVPTERPNWMFDITLKDQGDGTEVSLRLGPSREAARVDVQNAAKEELRKTRENTVRTQFGAQLDAILAPARLWRSFDPTEPRPVARTISVSTGPYGTPANTIDMVGGKGIAYIAVWSSDNMLRGLRITNRAGGSQLVGAEKGTRMDANIAEGEYVAGVYGSHFHYVHSIFLETTFGKRLYGGSFGAGYRFSADLPPELKARLVNITASPGANAVNALQFHWEYTLEGDFPVTLTTTSVIDDRLWAPAPVLNLDVAKAVVERLKRKAVSKAKAAVKQVASKAKNATSKKRKA